MAEPRLKTGCRGSLSRARPNRASQQTAEEIVSGGQIVNKVNWQRATKNRPKKAIDLTTADPLWQWKGQERGDVLQLETAGKSLLFFNVSIQSLSTPHKGLCRFNIVFPGNPSK